jgi:hypothetical protein
MRLIVLTPLVAAAMLLFGCANKVAPPAPPPALPVAHIDAPPAPYCAKPPELEAIEVEGLKSRLMVTALSCGAQDKYNGFIQRYRTALAADDKTVDAYFRRNYGRSAESQHDEYITSLANAQSQIGTQEGVTFCQQNVGRFDDVQALGSPSDLPNYAAAKPVDQPYVFAVCN